MFERKRRVILEAVERLPPQCQAAFTLKVFHGLSYREIANQLDISTESVEQHVAHGLLYVHEYLSKHHLHAKQ